MIIWFKRRKCGLGGQPLLDIQLILSVSQVLHIYLHIIYSPLCSNWYFSLQWCSWYERMMISQRFQPVVYVWQLNQETWCCSRANGPCREVCCDFSDCLKSSTFSKASALSQRFWYHINMVGLWVNAWQCWIKMRAKSYSIFAEIKPTNDLKRDIF